MSERTQQMYVRAVRQLAEHYHKSPDKITEEELRQYFLHIKNDKKWSRAGITIALCGIKFFYEKTLKRKWPIFDVVRPHAEKKLPVILSRNEVRLILSKVRLPRYRICLQTIYSCGLRLQEGTYLKEWVVDCPAGRDSGERAIKYFAPSIFRVAISNRRLVKSRPNEPDRREHLMTVT